MMADVLVFGSAIIDFICYVQRFPNIGETIHGNKFKSGFGGKGANQCVAASKLGAKTALIAKVGDDTWGNLYLENLKKENVNIDFVEKVPGYTTGIAQITVANDTGDNTIVIVAGANKKLSSVDIKNADNLFQCSKVLLCQLETEFQATLDALKIFKGISILNAAPAMTTMSLECVELLQFSDIFCINESEAECITNGSCKNILEAKNALHKLVQMGGNIIIITLGKEGAIYTDKKSPCVIHVPTQEVKAIDTTGAGDCFLGALAYLLSRHPKRELHQIIGCACEISAISVQGLGTQSSFPRYKEINQDLFNKKFDFKIIE